MIEETNPRYPHWCRIIRKTVEDPMEDEEDFSPLDGEVVDGSYVKGNYDDYDPMGGDDDGDVMETEDNEQQDGSDSSEDTETEKDTVEDSQITVIYEGVCRSYKINTTSDKGEVITSQRGLALPLNQDGWDELGLVPKEGDEIVVVHGTTFKEYGRVVDKNVATASFAGTHLVWRYGRN